MVTKWTTIKPVVARVVRNIKANMDWEFMEDLPVWISEAVMKMGTTYQLELKYAKLTVDFHMAQLPCSMEALGALLYQGKRMLPSQNVGPVGGFRQPTTTGVFVSKVQGGQPIAPIEATDINTNMYFTNILELEKRTQVDTSNYYRLNYNRLETNIESGELLLYYWDVPKDVNGFAMIPDNENYKTALYWYCRMMMIGAGFDDRVFDYGTCERNWEVFSPRAINEIIYPTPDEIQRNIIDTVRLIPVDLWSNFGSGGAEGQFLD